MTNQVLQFLDQIGVYLVCLFIPGFLLTLGGIRNIVRRRAVSVSRDGGFHWKKPVYLTGKDAVEAGGCTVVLGIGLLLLGILAIIGFLV
jgi:hypothetical protein